MVWCRSPLLVPPAISGGIGSRRTPAHALQRLGSCSQRLLYLAAGGVLHQNVHAGASLFFSCRALLTAAPCLVCPCPPRSCGYVFCSGHRHAQDHNCSFDYAAFDKVRSRSSLCQSRCQCNVLMWETGMRAPQHMPVPLLPRVVAHMRATVASHRLCCRPTWPRPTRRWLPPRWTSSEAASGKPEQHGASRAAAPCCQSWRQRSIRWQQGSGIKLQPPVQPWRSVRLSKTWRSLTARRPLSQPQTDLLSLA